MTDMDRSPREIPLPPRTGVIWHLTDLHFPPEPVTIPEDGKSRPFGKRIFDRKRPFEALLEYARGCDHLKADLLVVSGDFVDASRLAREPQPDAAAAGAPRAPRDEQGRRRSKAFEQAKEFLVALADAHGLREHAHERVVVCPGNHDVDWSMAAERAGDSVMEYRAYFSSFVCPYGGTRQHHSDPALGVCLLPLDTTPVGGAPFFDIGETPVQLDAGAYVPDRLDSALERLKTGSTQPACPVSVLGIVVAHHPPTVTPTAGIEVKPFEIAIGAAQAKSALHREGFRLFLNGHKHLGLVQEERIHLTSTQEDGTLLILSGPAFLSMGGEGRGFTVLEYAVSPAFGEARVRVHPHRFDNYSPTREPSRLFAIAPRTVDPIRELRITERIAPSGDSRADYEYRGIPVPDRGDPAGWVADAGYWVRQFRRNEGADQDVAAAPRVVGLTPETTVVTDLSDELAQRANRSFCIQVRVRQNAPVQSVSFVERTFTFGAYSVSKGHQRRVAGAPTTCPGVELGWEAIMHVVQEPVQTLEFNILLPFALKHSYPVEVEAYTAPDGRTLVRNQRLLEFSEWDVEANFAAKRVSVSIRHPMVGVGYLVKWELPENDPAVGELGVHDQAYRDGLDLAARFQTQTLNPGGGAEQMQGALEELLGRHVELIHRAGGAIPEDEVEWALFVPQRPDAGPVRTVNGRPNLVPAFASYAPGSPRWISWPAGRGVAGRCFALNSEVEYVSPRSLRYKSPMGSDWVDVKMPVYEEADGSIRHSVLYGLPVRIPAREDLIWAVLCLGTERDLANLDLNVLIEPPYTLKKSLTAASLSLMKTLTDIYSRKLHRYMQTGGGIGFADPMAPEEPQPR